MFHFCWTLQVHAETCPLQVPESLSRTWYLSQLNYGWIDLLGWRPAHHIINLGCLLSGLAVSEYRNPSITVDAPMRSLWWHCRYFYQQLWWSCCWLPLCGQLLNQSSPAEFLLSSCVGMGVMDYRHWKLSSTVLTSLSSWVLLLRSPAASPWVVTDCWTTLRATDLTDVMHSAGRWGKVG